jgi:molybdopterin-guanine dinucleotide biosynthesis protein A
LGPIGGLYTGALHARGELVFVAACDMPCINQNLVKFLFSLADGYDAVIPCWSKEKLEPLHAVYRRSALVDYLNHHNSLSLRTMVKNLKSRYVNVETMRGIDPDLSSFTNINKLDELAEINKLEHECDEWDRS